MGDPNPSKFTSIVPASSALESGEALNAVAIDSQPRFVFTYFAGQYFLHIRWGVVAVRQENHVSHNWSIL
jgi:hypothetical protein